MTSEMQVNESTEWADLIQFLMARSEEYADKRAFESAERYARIGRHIGQLSPISCGVNDDGVVCMEWCGPYGIATLDFLSDGRLLATLFVDGKVVESGYL